jgi:hypothetical protein
MMTIPEEIEQSQPPAPVQTAYKPSAVFHLTGVHLTDIFLPCR